MRVSYLSEGVLVAALAVLLPTLTACDKKPQIIDPGPSVEACTDNAQCGSGAGLVCAGGTCVIGQCDPVIEATCGPDVVGADRSAYCCLAWENCNPLTFQCERDPGASGIGCPPGAPDDCKACGVDEDCEQVGDFCSGGRCFAPQGRTTCAQSYQCPTGERCDRTVRLCVPDNGGCGFCGSEFPELCCENEQICDEQSGQCITLGDEECTPATVVDDCRQGQQCDQNGRCVQCINDGDCGPGLECNEGTGFCFSVANRCENDAACGTGRRCSPTTEECVVPTCEEDSDCFDDRERCDLERFSCFLPPASCTEDDEPNNSIATAIELQGVADTYAGSICRGDSDFIAFPVVGERRYTATVTIGTGTFSGLSLAMLNTDGVVESTAQFGSSPAAIVVNGVSGPGEEGFFYVRVTGSATARDSWSYTVTLREQPAGAEPDCSGTGQMGQEPNDDFATATNLALDTPTTFSRCGTNDADFFKITVPELHGVTVVVDQFYNAEGNINVEIFKGPQTSQRVRQAATTSDSETVDAPEAGTEFWVKVALGTVNGALQNQSYRVAATAVPRSEDCAADIGENDGTFDIAQVLTTMDNGGVVTGSLTDVIRCNAQDQDHFRFTVPARLGGAFRATFTHSEGDIAIDLLDTAGVVLATSNTSSAGTGAEALDLPIATMDVDYIARVRLGSSASTNIIGQHYDVALATYDAGQCVITEPVPNGSLLTGRCIGGFPEDPALPCLACGEGDACSGGAICVSGTCRLPLPLTSTIGGCTTNPATAGCGVTCGNGDQDHHRLGPLVSGQGISAHLEFATAEGGLSLALFRKQGAGVTQVSTARDENSDGSIDLDAVVGSSQTGEYSIAVLPQGSGGHEGQVYALTANVTPPCTPDMFEPGNNTPATSTLVPRAADPENINASICAGDVDIYEFIAQAGVTFSLQLQNAPRGARLAIGTRPTNLTSAPVVIGGEPPVVVETNGGSSPVLDYNSPRLQQIYVVVDRTTGAATGTYTLRLDY